MGKGFVNVSGGGGSEDKIKKLEEGLENHTHDKIVFVDDRNDGVTPENTTPGITVHLKNNTADGLNVGGSLHSVVTVRSWHDMTGPKIHELGFTDNGILAHRYSTGDGTWSEWSYVAHQYDLANYFYLGSWQAATDFNTLLTSGIYQFQGVNQNTPYGSSTDTHFHVMVIRHSDDWIRQVAYDVRTQNIYTRVKLNGTWYAWQQIVLGSDLAAKQDASTAITTGNIGSQNVNYATYAAIGNYDQDYGARLRNQALVTSDTTPPSNGQIYWTYG